MKHVRLKTISLSLHPEYNERWIHDVIADDPSILGLGDVIVKDRERIQPGAGRLDMLLQDSDGHGRYEVEIQLGSTDESHIIRTIEYWDIERRRYPQYDHTAVIIAEDITSRFLNIVSLFNGFIPIMALQLSAIETAEGVGLHFVKVLDTVRLGLDDEEPTESSDRTYWETKRGTPETVRLADRVLEIAREFVPNVEASYNKEYIGCWIDGKACNFVTCCPQKKALRVDVHLPQTEELGERLEAAGLTLVGYDRQWNCYRIKLQQEDIQRQHSFIKELLSLAYQRRTK